ncbi:MAG: glutaredoxin family protein [Patescibacteria group bacterium]
MAEVTIFTTPTCVYCKMAKEYFKEHNVAYGEKDVYHDETARAEMFEKSGQMGVPVIKVKTEGSEEYIVGFNKDRLAALLGIKEE